MTTGQPRSAARATYALIGWPLVHSLSPAMHEAAFSELGIDARYALRPTVPADLPRAVEALRAGDLAGANVTVPHKVAVRDLLDEDSDLVAAIGAVNTIVRGAGGLRGENTDVAGFRHALGVAGAADGRDRRAVVLGAGGGARAAVLVLVDAGYDVTVLNRSLARLAALQSALHRARPGAPLRGGRLAPESVVASAAGADLLVNATAIGAASGRLAGERPRAAQPAAPPSGPSAERHLDVAPAPGGDVVRSNARACPWPADRPVPARLTVIDLVAWPVETGLVERARRDGATAHGGLEMLIGQAAAAFALWTGRTAPMEVMRRAVTE